MSKARVAIIGAGIAGLAHARAAAMRGYQVTVYERDAQASGASVRNFGLCLLLGQPQGELLDLAERSRAIWLEALPACGAWHRGGGSMVVARNGAEQDVLQAFHHEHGVRYGTRLLDAKALAGAGLNGLSGLASDGELALDARATLPRLAAWLEASLGVRFEFNTRVSGIDLPVVHTSRGPREADQVIVCAGHDFQSLYPTHFARLGLRQCALQMLRVENPGIRLEAALMTGLSTLHYDSFRLGPALRKLVDTLRQQVGAQEPALLEHGIHLIVQQVGSDGDLIIGDSHRYDDSVSPFRLEEIDAQLLGLAESVLGRSLRVKERWQGVYASGQHPIELMSPAPGVTAVVITAGIGMSISFALAEEVVNRALD